MVRSGGYRKESPSKSQPRTPRFTKTFLGEGIEQKRYIGAVKTSFEILIPSYSALEDYIQPIEAHVSALLDEIDGHPRVDISAVFQVFAFKLMSHLTFSLDFPAEGQEGARETLNLLDRSQTLLSTFGHVPWIYDIAKYIPGLLRSNAQFSRLANLLVEKRRAVEPETPDIFSYLLKTENNPHAAGFPLSWEARLAIVVGRYV
jgi:cytochrome P450